ncbi:hypothetical protein IAI10_23610 [Clostridium sp. 19966]|uniref:hypothetical protein n=1 Tax=Clostridium sp. 19966 TaxID=2768166 RepID=UPI0028DF4ADA|nr:hypothetical protein [Clostridium sp. 19966]MDT8719633.1 hypothetical protein [Clostridium sp. 19966]
MKLKTWLKISQFQFNTPAQYVPMIRAENSSNVWSSPVYPDFDIEPASGSRPTASFNHALTSLVPKNLTFNVSWTSSQSQNSSSTLKNSETLVLNTASLNDDQVYDKPANSTTDFSNCTQDVSTSDIGTYYVLTSVEDSNGYWSGWKASQVQIEDSSVKIINPVVSGDEGTVRWNMGSYPSYTILVYSISKNQKITIGINCHSNFQFYLAINFIFYTNLWTFSYKGVLLHL